VAVTKQFDKIIGTINADDPNKVDVLVLGHDTVSLVSDSFDYTHDTNPATVTSPEADWIENDYLE